MSRRKYIFAGAMMALGLGIGAVVGWAQDKPSAGQEASTKNLFDDPLKRALAVMDKMEQDYSQEKLSIDEEAAEILRTLKNPFVPQLPSPEKPSPSVVGPTAAVVRPTTDVISPTVTPVMVKPNFKIAGFVWDTKHPQAIINSIIVTPGESLDGWEIKMIGKDGINVEKNGYQYWLKP
jgi:hypothetical protein